MAAMSQAGCDAWQLHHQLWHCRWAAPAVALSQNDITGCLYRPHCPHAQCGSHSHRFRPVEAIPSGLFTATQGEILRFPGFSGRNCWGVILDSSLSGQHCSEIQLFWFSLSFTFFLGPNCGGVVPCAFIIKTTIFVVHISSDENIWDAQVGISC